MSFDVVVIGAGPAGVQLGYYLEKEAKSTGLSYVLFDRAATPGSFFEVYPRSNMLISINKVYTGSNDREFNFRHDWNSLCHEEDDPELFFKHYTEDLFPKREVFTQYMQAFTQRTGINVQYNTSISKISKSEGVFTLLDSEGKSYTAKNVFVATGTVAPFIPAIEGIQHCWKYSEGFPQTKEHWKNKRVLILGKGNSAFETADQLSPWAAVIHCASPNPVSLAWDTHFVGNLRAINNGYLDFYQLKSQHGMISGNINKFNWKEIDENGIGRGVSVEYDFTISPEDPVVEFTYDEVILCTGWLYNNPDLFDESVKVATCHRGKFADVSPIWESTTTPNLFFSGAAMGGRGYKKNTTGFIHGFRYCCRSQLAAVLNREYGRPLPMEKVANTIDDIAKSLITRVNRCAAGYQMFSVLVDTLLIPKKDSPKPEELDFVYEVHTDYAKELFKDQPYIEVMLQYGDRGAGTPAFAFEQQSTPQKPDLSWALHPCFRFYYQGRLLSRVHLLETAELNWDIPKYHVEPLKAWLMKVFDLVNGPDLATLPELKSELPLATTTITYRGPEGEEHKTKMGLEKMMNY